MTFFNKMLSYLVEYHISIDQFVFQCIILWNNVSWHKENKTLLLTFCMFLCHYLQHAVELQHFQFACTLHVVPNHSSRGCNAHWECVNTCMVQKQSLVPSHRESLSERLKYVTIQRDCLCVCVCVSLPECLLILSSLQLIHWSLLDIEAPYEWQPALALRTFHSSLCQSMLIRDQKPVGRHSLSNLNSLSLSISPSFLSLVPSISHTCIPSLSLSSHYRLHSPNLY